MKAQVLANFIIEYTIPDEEQIEERSKLEPTTLSWILHVDGTSNIQGSGVGLILINPDRIVMEYTLNLVFALQ